MKYRRLRVSLFATLAVAVVGLFLLLSNRDRSTTINESTVSESTVDDEMSAAEKTIARTIDSEEIILEYTPKLAQLAAGVLNLKLPDFHSRDLFSPVVEVADLAIEKEPSLADELPRIKARIYHWPLSAQERKTSFDDLQLWKEALRDVRYFRHAKFYFVRGKFLDSEQSKWRADVGFTGLARMSDDSWRLVKAKQQLDWQRHSPSTQVGKPRWYIARWHQKSFTTIEAPWRAFAETLDLAVRERGQLAKARTSIHHQLVVKMAREHLFTKDFTPLGEPFDALAEDRHPGIAVVDLDQDGFDDLYVLPHWGTNQFFHNQGDGTLVEIASEIGLDFENYCTCALFADFDNDGDSDLLIGRSLKPSLYLVNEEGTFVDRSAQLVSTVLPSLVSSITAADYDNDGLLDVYFSTYAGNTVQYVELNEGIAEKNGKMLTRYLSEPDSVELYRRAAKNEMITARVGPPNLLLRNLGGRFERAPVSDDLAVWRNTFQSSWGDFDDDGDDDLYVANDFAKNQLFQNQGDGSFLDVTDATDTADIGFGMGASWGDYDNDGRQDLYVSNMYSKAGRRITSQVRGIVDPRFERMAQGNSLLHNNGETFDRVSGLQPPALLVEKAGWSWGSQFADFDNDGFLDIYALSGFYSAPKEIAVQVDL